jgi:chorismate mutase/prephenate dehydratase
MIDENFDLMTEYDCAIIGEQIIRINHALLGLPEANIQDIKTVYSHPQALMQCSNYLNENHPEFDRRSLLNTAMSAKKVKEDGLVSQAAIAGKINAEIYGLKILDEKIQDDKTNATRFLIVSSQKNFLEDANKLSISFELNDDMGSLYHILSNFTYNGLNMSRIESRPVKERPWAYRFFVDLSGNLNNEAVQNALVGLHEEANSIQILGNY